MPGVVGRPPSASSPNHLVAQADYQRLRSHGVGHAIVVGDNPLPGLRGGDDQPARRRAAARRGTHTDRPASCRSPRANLPCCRKDPRVFGGVHRAVESTYPWSSARGRCVWPTTAARRRAAPNTPPRRRSARGVKPLLRTSDFQPDHSSTYAAASPAGRPVSGAAVDRASSMLTRERSGRARQQTTVTTAAKDDVNGDRVRRPGLVQQPCRQ